LRVFDKRTVAATYRRAASHEHDPSEQLAHDAPPNGGHRNLLVVSRA
jgi:hypothetical protein